MTATATTDFINSLTDTELQFLYHYKYTSYLESSGKLIVDELSKRGIDKDRVWKFVMKYKVTEGACSRCGSDKFLNDIQICSVCGFDILEEEKKPTKSGRFLEFIGRILEAFGH